MFLIHERHGWPRTTGSGPGLHAKWKSLCKPTWNLHECRQNNSIENVYVYYAFKVLTWQKNVQGLKTVILDIKCKQFELSSYSRFLTSGFNLRTRVLKSVTAAQELLDMRSSCHAAIILPVGVRGTKNVWCLSSLVRTVTTSNKCSPLFSLWLTKVHCPISKFVLDSAVFFWQGDEDNRLTFLRNYLS